MTRPSLLSRIAAVVLLVHAAALVVPIAHEAGDLARGHAACDAPGGGEAEFRASCDPGCRVPGHEHHGHDPATCQSCRVLSGLGTLLIAGIAAPPPASLRCDFAGVASVASREALGAPASRGPPSLTA